MLNSGINVLSNLPDLLMKRSFESQGCAQHSVQLTVGTRRVFGIFWLWAFSVSRASLPSQLRQLTQTISPFEA
jgi:hypothetical protein